MTKEELREIEQDLRLNKTKEQLVELCLGYIEMLEQATDQTRRALIRSGDLKLS